MNILLTEDSEYLFSVAKRYDLTINELITANPHLRNFHIIGRGQLLAIPHSEKVKFDSLYQLKATEFYPLANTFALPPPQTEVITWTIVVSGGEAIVTLAGTAAVAGITVVVGVAAAAGLAYLTSGEKNLRMNSATNVGVPPPSSPNASVNSNSNSNVMGASVLLTEMAKAVKKIEAQFGKTLEHLGYLQNGKGPDCLPGSQCYEDNKNHWKGEIKAFLGNAEKYLKNVRGKTKEAYKKTIEQLVKDADKF